MTSIAMLSTAHIHARQFLRNVAEGSDGRRIHALWDDLPERGQRYAAEFKARFEPDIAELLRDPAVDAFTVAAENTRQLPLLEQVMPVGKPVFCEKPLSTSPVISAADRPFTMDRLIDVVRGGVSDDEVRADLAACLDCRHHACRLRSRSRRALARRAAHRLIRQSPHPPG
jgi:hypothetical protein